MENLNAETVKRALEWCIQSESCEYCEYKSAEDIDVCGIKSDALALINELTQANEQLSESYDHLEKTKDELLSERARLTEENESLGAEKEHLELVVEGKLKRTSALEKQVLSLTEENKKIGIENFDLICELSRIKADTVKKVADLLWEGESEKLNISVGGKYYDKQEFIVQIAKEILEGGTDG